MLYRESQAAAYDLIMDWSLEEHKALRLQVPKTGLQTPFRGGKVQDVAHKVLLPPCKCSCLFPLGDYLHLVDRLQQRLHPGSEARLCLQVLQLSRQGLNERGLNEAAFLEPLQEMAASGRPAAALLREKFHNEWHGSVDPIYNSDYTY